jgi:hypothetical protein
VVCRRNNPAQSHFAFSVLLSFSRHFLLLHPFVSNKFRCLMANHSHLLIGYYVRLALSSSIPALIHSHASALQPWPLFSRLIPIGISLLLLGADDCRLRCSTQSCGEMHLAMFSVTKIRLVQVESSLLLPAATI